MKPQVPALRRFLNTRAPGWIAVSRGAALGLALLMVLNLLEVFVYSTSAVKNWMTDLAPLGQSIGITVLAMAATSLLMFSMRTALPGPVQLTAFGNVALFAGFCGRELYVISQRVAEAERAIAMTGPLGVLMLFSVAGVGILLGNSDAVQGRSSFISILGSAVLTVLAFSVVTIQSGGLSDIVPEKSVPALIVSGCAPDADGKTSEALDDRMQTASQLLQEKHAKNMIVARGSLEVSDFEVMLKLAVDAGVEESQVVADSAGTSIAASLDFVLQREEFKSDKRIIIVSHWHELARIRILARRAGFEVTAVAAKQKHALFGQNKLVLSEVGGHLLLLFEPAVVFARNSMRPAAPP